MLPRTGLALGAGAVLALAFEPDQVRLPDGLTPAVRIGPWLGGSAVAVTVVGLLLGLLPYRRRQPAGEGDR